MTRHKRIPPKVGDRESVAVWNGEKKVGTGCSDGGVARVGSGVALDSGCTIAPLSATVLKLFDVFSQEGTAIV